MYKNKNLTIKETFELAYLNQQQNNHKIAESLYNEILKIDPNHLTSHSNLGALFLSLGEFQKAKECYEKAIEINPNYVNAHNNLGNIFKELEKYQKAKDVMKKQLKLILIM